MKKFSLSIIILFFLVVNFISCAQNNSSINSITVQQLNDKIKNDTNLVILDVRTPEELAGPLGKIDGVINIPVQNLTDRVHELDKYKNREIAVICRTGHRSKKGTEILIKNGFDAENVLGGMTEYRAQEKKN